MVERWSVKTLTDSGAARVNLTPQDSSVINLRGLPAPDISTGAKRQAGEFTTYRLRVRLRSFKIEKDSDIHLVVADPSDATKRMIVELPNSGCARKAAPASRRRLAAARRALLAACGTPATGSFRLLTGTATITGVAFFDVLHGQQRRGAQRHRAAPAAQLQGPDPLREPVATGPTSTRTRTRRVTGVGQDRLGQV